MQRVALMLAALWWGGISGLSFLAVPVLFARLGAPVAGPVAAQLFSFQCWAGILIGLALLLVFKAQRPRGGAAPDEERLALNGAVLGNMGFVLLAMLLAMVQEFGVAQKIVTARAMGGNLQLLHTLGSAMVLGQWLCAGVLVWRTSMPTGR
ncbi:MAG: DUF4149 domain-containing protein [Hydrogenophaga sp.]|jgi:hypothetical protein|nr:DUF4149 domain-containing protein [Hydrogenophaga sp.]